MHVSDICTMCRQTFRAWLRDFCVRIILTFVPREMEKGQAGKAGGKKHPSRQEAFGVLQKLPSLGFALFP